MALPSKSLWLLAGALFLTPLVFAESPAQTVKVTGPTDPGAHAESPTAAPTPLPNPPSLPAAANGKTAQSSPPNAVSNSAAATPDGKPTTPTVVDDSHAAVAADPHGAVAGDAKAAVATMDFETLWQQGIKNYREQKYEEARQDFARASALRPRDLGALTNWGLTESKLGHNPLALALLRKVLFVDPEFTTAEKAIDFISSNLPVKEVPHEITWMENLHGRFLSTRSLATGLGFSAFFLLGAGWLLLSSIGRRRRAFKAETSVPPVSGVGIFLFCLFLVSATWSVLKFLDISQDRATIIVDKLSLMSAPDSASVPLLDLYGGLQVLVENHASGDWVQVTYPGAITGWVRKSEIMIESEPAPHPH